MSGKWKAQPKTILGALVDAVWNPNLGKKEPWQISLPGPSLGVEEVYEKQCWRGDAAYYRPSFSEFAKSFITEGADGKKIWNKQVCGCPTESEC